MPYLSLREPFEPDRDDSFCASNNKFSLICTLVVISRSAKEPVVLVGSTRSIHGSKEKKSSEKIFIFSLVYLL